MPRMPSATAALPALNGLTVLERGWLSSNNILIHAAPGEPGAVLVDTSHSNHADQTVALLRHALQGQRLDRVLNTHLHSDHCGGNAAVQAAFGAPVIVPPGQAAAVMDWDAGLLTHDSTGQRCDRFTVAGTLPPGSDFVAGGRRWEVLAAPGHDPHSVMLFDHTQGVLISADALWEHGFGLVFPEIEGEPGFDDVATVLDLIERLPVRAVVPGHGAPFGDVAAALTRARARLAGFVADPARHARHGLKVLIKYHLMELHQQGLEALLLWAVGTPLLVALWQRFGRAGGGTAEAWVAKAVQELVTSGALELREGVVYNV
jgi:glyoxylase-like metal-dependent hydrolase (beta-lactamase superfamily II)